MLARCRFTLRGRAASGLLGVASALVASSCSHPAAEEIYSTPRTACPGQPFLLKWSARGKGVISACPKPPRWSDMVVDGPGETHVAIETTTTFTLTVPEADARVQSKLAEVALPTMDRSAVVKCDVPGEVYGRLNLSDIPNGVRVRKLQNPVATADGKRAPREVCVIHLGQARCVEPGHHVDLDEPAQGDWELRLPDGAGIDCASGPGKLGIQLELGCS